MQTASGALHDECTVICLLWVDVVRHSKRISMHYTASQCNALCASLTKRADSKQMFHKFHSCTVHITLQHSPHQAAPIHLPYTKRGLDPNSSMTAAISCATFPSTDALDPPMNRSVKSAKRPAMTHWAAGVRKKMATSALIMQICAWGKCCEGMQATLLHDAYACVSVCAYCMLVFVFVVS